MELTKNAKQGRCRCFGWHLVSVIFIAFGFSLVIFFPEFFNDQLLKVSHKLDSDKVSRLIRIILEPRTSPGIENFLRMEKTYSAALHGHLLVQLDKSG
jgi:hypothetical protein